MDQQALALAKAIRQAETGGIANPYQAKGASGETGAFQFMPETWKGWSKQYLGQENAPLTVANQNKVAYLRIKELKDQGLKPAQIASAWNSGRADAYKQNFKGTNSKGVAYDVPAYVAKVSQYYKQFRPAAQPQAPKTRYDVAPNREFQLQKAQAEAQTAQKEADKYKGLGFLKEATKEFVGMIAPGPVGLGKTIQKTFGNQRDTYLQSINTLTKSQADLAKTIREKEARGEDATRMKQIFNQNADQLDELQAQFAQENELPTTGQVAGQIGSTTLDLLTAGTYGKATQGMKAFQRGKAAPTAFTGLTQDARFLSRPTAKAVATGAGIGYGYDVTQGMIDQEKSPLTPGIGTAVGAGLGIASRAAVATGRPKSAKINDIVSQYEKELSKIENSNSSLRKLNEFSKEDAVASRTRILKSDVLQGAVDENGTITTKDPGGAVEQYRKAVFEEGESLGREVLEKEGAKISIAQVERKITDAINTAKTLSAGEKESAIKKVTKELNALKKEYTDDMIPLTRLQDEKIANYAMINFQTPIEVGTYRKALARAYKELIEEASSTNIKEINKELSKYYTDIERLELLHGRKVKGGRLGKYFSQIAGNIIGGAAGSTAGPIGSAIGAIIGGEVSSLVKGATLSRSFGKATGGGFPKSSILKQARKDVEAPRLALPAQTTPFRRVLPSTKTIELPARTQSSAKAPIINRSDSVPQSNRLGNTNTMYNKASEITTNAIDKVSNKPAIKASADEVYVKINPKVEPEVVVALKKNSEFERALAELEALTEIAEAGSRSMIGYGSDVRFIANKSTFPKWIPEELRSKKLMEKTLKHLEEGTIPKKNATREQGLYAEFVDYIEQRVETPEDKSLRQSTGQSAFKMLKEFFGIGVKGGNRGFIINPLATKKALPKSKVNESVSSLNNSIDLKTKRDVVLTDITGKKVTVPKDAVIKAGTTKSSNMIVDIDGKQYTVNKNQFQNLKGQSLVAEAREFAPELKGTEEVVKGGKTTAFEDVEWGGEKGNMKGTLNGRKFGIKDEGDKWYVYEENGVLGKEVKNYTQAVEELERYLAKDTPVTKYSSYTLPNGENYREILIQAPLELKLGQYGTDVIDTSKRFRSSHWDEDNVISHLRMNDRTYNGKKLVFMEELQSDWAREGRSKGFKSMKEDFYSTDKELSKLQDDLSKKYKEDDFSKLVKLVTPEEKSKWNILTEQRNKLYSQKDGIPNHPLLKNWQEPTIKRALMDAVDNDAKYFAWINGDQTSARYNLATYVDDVEWKAHKKPEKIFADDIEPIKFDKGTNIRLNSKEGSKININIDKNGVITDASTSDWKGKKLDEVLGKGLADKIMADESGTLAGDGLKFGGEWANNLYDKQVKNIVEDLTGAKVKEFDLGLTSDGKVNTGNSKQLSKQLGIELTPEIVARIKGEAPSFTPKKRALPGKEIIIPSLILFLMTQKDE